MSIIDKPIVKTLMLKGERGEVTQAQLDQVKIQVNDLASGSPLVASSTSEMTDTTRVYVNTTDGKWYYYDGDSWEIGGTYQATSDHDILVQLGVISYKNITIEVGKENYFIKNLDGCWAYGTNMAISKPIHLNKGDTINSIQRSTTSVSAISLYNPNLSSTVPTTVLVSGTQSTSSTGAINYSYTATENIDIVLSYNTTIEPNVTITTSNKANTDEVYNKVTADGKFATKGEINSSKIYFSKLGDILSIFIKSPYVDKYTKYIFQKIINTTTHYNSWKISDIYICDSEMQELYSLSINNSGIECEGALLETGASDFIGGYHGDEYMYDINILVNNEEIDITQDYPLTICNDIQARVSSYLNRCNTETKVFERFKSLKWDNNGLTIKNHLVVTDTITISQPALSMLAIKLTENNNPIVSKYSYNKNMMLVDIPTYEDEQDHSFANTVNFVKGELFGNLYTKVEMSDFDKTSHFNDNNRGQFTKFANGRIKIYEYPFVSKEFVANDEIFCTSKQVIFPVN